MAPLPFVVQPRRQPILERIGTEESGIIEVERRGYLTTGEKSLVQQVQQSGDGTAEIVTLSRQIARKYALGMDKAYNLIIAVISNSKAEDQKLAEEIETEFAEELTSIVKGLASGQIREELIFAFCLLRYRVDPDFAIEDIQTVHPDIISGLAALYRDEESRSLEAFNTPQEGASEKAPSIEEVEKKSVKTGTSRSKTTTGA
jgi:hypothetical protein